MILLAHQALYRKYLPKRLREVVGQEHIVQTIGNVVVQDSLSHAYLFVGSRGTGKTSVAKLLANLINCKSPT